MAERNDVANFKVDSRLSSILGNYPSCERALRELVDNSWDAEAKHVKISLPSAMTNDPVVIEDDGHGMKEREVREEYLNIANPRTGRQGKRTPNLNRLVKGQRGIGKFAGLVMADIMELKTRAAGTETTLLIDRKALVDGNVDIESVPLRLETTSCGVNEHGTTIILRELNPRLSYPEASVLEELLALDYGKETEIEITVNDKRVTNYRVQGELFTTTLKTSTGVEVQLNFTIADKPLKGKRAGFIIREGNKSIGRPSFLGLENNDWLPKSMINRCTGEIIVPTGSVELTANGVDFFEGDKTIREVSTQVCEKVMESLKKTHSREFNLAKGRLQRTINQRLSLLPETRRKIVQERIDRLVRRSYNEGEKEERIVVLVSLVMDALEIDEYWTVCQTIEEADKSDVIKFANALEGFGIAEMTFVVNRAKNRLTFLDNLYELTQNPETLEKQMHDALANNLWVFGAEYGLMASNKTLRGIIADYVGGQYKEDDANDRPDLLLNSGYSGNYLIVEFKRPSIKVGRDAEMQAKKYADTIGNKLNADPDVFVVGGDVDPKMRDSYGNDKIRFFSYAGLIATARSQLEWLIRRQGVES